MNRILIGTSGYSYSDWVGSFYPPGTRQSEYLRFFSAHFNTTELNFTYYRQPEAGMIKRMAETVGDDFTFSVKAHRTLTHDIDPAQRVRETQTFMQGVEPLLIDSKLASVLLQFPHSFHYTSTNRKYLDALCNGFGEIPLAVEFRGRDWQRESVYKELESRKLALVNVDEPRLPKLPKPTALVTSDLAYVRFHGRNRKNWWCGDNVSRYDYSYSEEELKEWIPKIRLMQEIAGVVLLVFNNHSKGQAVRNALKLREMLGRE
ncbi:MAG: DUF72 domain-containing protein [Chitinispirillaceae bacterium]